MTMRPMGPNSWPDALLGRGLACASALIATGLVGVACDEGDGSSGGGGGAEGLAGLDDGDAPPDPNLPAVVPATESSPVLGFGDAADDPAIWVHPTDPDKSLVLGTDKSIDGGLFVYDLEGNELDFLQLGELNNVDVRGGFELEGKEVGLATATNRTDHTLEILAIDPDTLEVRSVAAGEIETMEESYGLCMYQSPIDEKYYVFVNSELGLVRQFELSAEGATVDATLVREFCTETQPEGCVADDVQQRLFIGEEAFGVWSFPAEEDAPSTGTEKPNCNEAIAGKKIAKTTADGGTIVADVEGIGLAITGEDSGYLIVSAQGDHEFVVLDRSPPHEPLLTFAVWGGGEQCVDGVEESDGLDVVTDALGDLYPEGLLVVQDGFNGDPVGKQNFKYIDLADVQSLLDDPDQGFEHAECNLGDYGGKPRYAGLPPGPERTDDFCAAFCAKCDTCYETDFPAFAEGDCHYKSPKPEFVLDDCLVGCRDGFVPADTRPLQEGWEDWECVPLDESL